jgi:hypothetical protein
VTKKRPGRPDFDALTEAQLIAGRMTGRRVYLKPANQQTVSDLLNEIDHVAEAATGERSFLHLKPLAAPGPSTKH